jgi:hypothetical protein
MAQFLQLTSYDLVGKIDTLRGGSQIGTGEGSGPPVSSRSDLGNANPDRPDRQP